MASIRQPDKIGQLSNSGLTISLGPSRLSVGGQQYVTTSNMSANLSSATANTLYMVFAVVTNGAIGLTISTNFNSVGPTGFTAWKLVGAFYSNGISTPSFGSFVNITGMPTTTEMSVAVSLTTNSGANAVTLNATSATQPYGTIRRIGGDVEYVVGFSNGSGGAATGTAGALGLPIPSNVSVDSTRIVNATTIGQSAQFASVYIAASGFQVSPVVVGSVVTMYHNGSGSAWALSDLSASAAIVCHLKYPVTGWSNTQIQDL